MPGPRSSIAARLTVRGIERLARHGEGAYAGHLTLTWAVDGIEYLVSSHGYGTASEDLAIQIARGIDLVEP